MSTEESPCQYVYRCWAADGRLLYIGCTQYPERRIREHQKRAAWASEMVEHEFEGPYRYFEGFAVERAAIEAEAPEFNKRWRVSA